MADEMARHHEPDNPDVHHEESDINVRSVLIGLAIVVVLAVIMHVGLWGMYVLFRKIDRSFDPQPATMISEPAPTAAGLADFTVHWSEPAKYLEVVREEDRKILEEYGWVNRSTGKVHVPIEVGMQMALRKGFPARQSAEAPVVGSGEGDTHAPWVAHPATSGGGVSSGQQPTDRSTSEIEEQRTEEVETGEPDQEQPVETDPHAGHEQDAGENGQ